MSIFQSEPAVNDPVHNVELPIRFECSVVEKVVRKHVRDRRQQACWDHWRPMLVPSLRQKSDMLGWEMLAGVIHDEARPAFARPIVLFSVVGNSKRKLKTEARIAVLACGAVLVLRGRSPARFSTCFFPDVACHTPRPEKRFCRVALFYVEKYAEESEGGHYAIPSHGHKIFIEGDQQEWRGKVRFLSPENWGFPSGLSGTLHSGSIPEWRLAPRSSLLPSGLDPEDGQPSKQEYV